MELKNVGIYERQYPEVRVAHDGLLPHVVGCAFEVSDLGTASSDVVAGIELQQVWSLGDRHNALCT